MQYEPVKTVHPAVSALIALSILGAVFSPFVAIDLLSHTGRPTANRLAVGTSPLVQVAASRADLDDLAAGRPASAFSVRAGTGVEVLSRGLARAHVRVKDGPHAGEDGWVPSEWVK